MSSKINLQPCEYARKSSIFQDNQLIFSKTIETYMGERKKNKNIMCKYTSYTVKYTLYTGIEKQRLFLMKNFFINIQTNVRSTRTRWR